MPHLWLPLFHLCNFLAAVNALYRHLDTQLHTELYHTSGLFVVWGFFLLYCYYLDFLKLILVKYMVKEE